MSRTLFDYGIPCIGIAEPHGHPAHSTRTARVLRLKEWTEDCFVHELLRLGHEFEQKPPLLATKDEAVLWLSANRAALAPFYEFALPPPQVVELLMNKALFLEHAHKHGLPVPRTWELTEEGALESLRTGIPFPCIIKPQVKNSEFRMHCNQKAYIAESFEQLLSFYREIAQWEPQVVIQEWIPGGDDRIAFSLCCYSRGSKLLGMFSGRKLRQWPVGCGNTALCEPAPEAWAYKLTPLTEKLFASVGYAGLGSVEYKMHPEGDRPFIMEPTVGRTNYQNEIAVLNGCPLPLFAYSDLTGLNIAPLKRRFPNTKLVDGLAELRSARVRLNAREITLGQALKHRLGSKRYMLFRISDPRPFFHWLRAAARSKGAGALRKFGLMT
ncbi:MAG: hypothetical protein U0136_11685 [Bdellovibrionota bacterium]